MAKPWIVSDSAQHDINEVIDNVVEFTTYTSSGVKLFNELLDKFELIGSLPKCGKRRDDGTREIFARSYRIIYKEYDDYVLIIAVIHSRRLYPRP